MEFKKLCLIIAISGGFLSCKKFIEVDPPKNVLVSSAVYQNDDLATSAMLGIYRNMGSSSIFGSGDPTSISIFCGLSADEFIGYGPTQTSVFDHQLIPLNSPTNNFWSQLYKTIYDANSILEGLERSSGVTPPVKAQLKGEAYFTRAFSYFYLINLYGGVPIHLSTDYTLNSKTIKSNMAEVYLQIISDLKLAEELLGDGYVTSGRVRPNKSAVHALMARTYLYLADWENAEKYATDVILKNTVYQLVSLDQIFLSNSQEAVWQLFPPAGGNTVAGNTLIPTGGTSTTVAPNDVSLSADFVEHAFESGDLRRDSWTRSYVANSIRYYYPFKYKVQNSTTVTEYFMVFRLAELFLIRAEARAQLNNLSSAINDVDAIRNRANLPLIETINPDISKDNLIDAIQKERQIELFSEWGDRWLNLKRTGKVNSILAPMKFNWKPEFAKYPIPFNEVSRNRNIEQNEGY